MVLPVVVPPAHEIYPVAGVTIGIAQAGIRASSHKANKDDLTVFVLAAGSTVAGVFTRNRFCAAPVQVCQRHLAAHQTDAAQAPIRALVVNTGNANAGTGEAGVQASLATCAATAQGLGVQAEQVLPFSTGVILEPLPVDKLIAALPQAIAQAKPDHWLAAAHSIMTTDTQPKIGSRKLELTGVDGARHTITLTGITKGAGMIRPNMATMLSYLATDADIPAALLQTLAHASAEQSFNRITVDGDMSTNDSFILIATGQSGLRIDSAQHPAWPAFKEAVFDLSRQLAHNMLRDGEGASKFITIRVEEAASAAEALKVAYTVAHSPLVKTAFSASDANLGRIVMAIGNANTDCPELDTLDAGKIELWLGGVHVVSRGQRHPDYKEADGQRVMQASDIPMRIALGRGQAAETVYTTDLSHDYVSINADYRS